MLKHYKIYNPDNNEYVTCVEHPTDDLHSLCGSGIDETPDGQPEETEALITCDYCLKIIKTIIENICPSCFNGPIDCCCQRDE